MDWSEVEPVLKATYVLLDEQETTTQDVVCEALGKPPQDERTIRALTQLYNAGYIEGNTFIDKGSPFFMEATEKGIQRTRGWPRDGGEAELVELLLRTLDERIESEETPEEEKADCAGPETPSPRSAAM